MTPRTARQSPSSSSSRALSAFARLPRAARWLVYAGILIVAYFAVVEPALDARNRFAAAADALHRDLRQLRSYTAPDSDAGAARNLVLTYYGAPAPPAPAGEFGRPAEFEAAVNEIFRAHAVRKDQTERRSVVNLPQESGILGENEMLQRQEITLTFEATPATVSQIVADLEAEPLVTSITRLRLDKAAARRAESAGAGLVKATIGVETWMIIARPGSGAGGVR